MNQFDAYAADYDATLNRGLKVTGEDRQFFAEGRIRWTKRRLTEIGARTAAVLDYGCGTGESAPLLASILVAARVVGVDTSAESLAIARRQQASERISFYDVAELPSRGPFDVAYVNGVFHHLPPSEWSPTLDALASVMTAGGILAFWENNPFNPGTRWVMRRLPFDRNAILLRPGYARRLLRAAGFEVLCTDYQFFFPRALAALRPIEPRLRSLPLGGQYVIVGRRGRPGSPA